MFWDAYSQIVTLFVAPALMAMTIGSIVHYFVNRHDRDN